ncbi:unnamed protein product [Prorocentrum cordatum]|uniref:Uncharacterized protein n=1 Tax=Prorocentrum cordatum TaxID=2364126 RepID=A0ABN9WGG4_9DINO|nr:unnamed protein product [Polarella glacialis]
MALAGGFNMDLGTLLKRHQPEGAAAGGEGRAAEDADDCLAAVEGALKARDIQSVLNILLKMACQHAQLLRDMAASEWISVATPTETDIVKVGKDTGRQYAQVAAIQAATTDLGPPHLYIARGAFRSLSESAEIQQKEAASHQLVHTFYTKYVSGANAMELGLMIRHFRLRKCNNEEYTRIQFAISDGLAIPKVGTGKGVSMSKLEIEQAVVNFLVAVGGRMKLGAAPQGHLEQLAQKLLDKGKKTDKGDKKR